MNFPELADPDFMRPYDLTMTYQRSSDFWAPYLPSLAAWRQVSSRAAVAAANGDGTRSDVSVRLAGP